MNSDKSIRWVGITDQNGIIINERYREGLKPLLTLEENHDFAINTINRHKTRLKFEPKMGELTYTFRRYKKLSRCLIPINENFYLLLTIDFDQYNFDKIIMEKIVPFIKQEKEKFVTNKKLNKENLDYIKYIFHDKDSEFYSRDYEILRDNR